MNATRVLNEVKKIIEDLEAELNLLDIKTKKLRIAKIKQKNSLEYMIIPQIVFLIKQKII